MDSCFQLQVIPLQLLHSINKPCEPNAASNPCFIHHLVQHLDIYVPYLLWLLGFNNTTGDLLISTPWAQLQQLGLCLFIRGMSKGSRQVQLIDIYVAVTGMPAW